MSLFNTSKSHSDSSQRTETQNTSSNANVQNTSGGINIARLDISTPSSQSGLRFGGGGGGGGVNIISTDQGAIGRATDLAATSVGVGKALGLAAFDLASQTNRTLATTQSDALATLSSANSDALSAVARSGSASLDTVGHFGQLAFDAVQASQAGALSQIDKALQSTLKTNNAAFETVARSQSTNVALSDLTTNVFKSGVTAVGILAVAAVIAVAVFRSR